MKVIAYKLLDILREVKSGTFVIPRFQRDFVWDASATCKLIDSIARSYPIGALLTLPVEALALPCTELKWAKATPASVGRPGDFHLLDGQQRLTSIARALIADDTRQYLFDLEAIYAELEGDGLDSYREECWVICRKKQKKAFSNPAYLRCEDALTTGMSYSMIVNFLRHKFPNITDDEMTQKLTPLLEVVEAVRNYQVIVHQMEKNEKIDAICRIFQTINNTGVKLDTFDLVVAKSFSSTYDLREKVTEIKENYPLMAGVENESLLHAIHYYNGLVEKKRPYLTKAALLATPPEMWAASLETAALAFTTVSLWLKTNRMHSSSKGDLVPMALQTIVVACEMLHPGSIDNQMVSVKLKRWLLSRLWGSSTYDKSFSEGDLMSLKTFFEAPRNLSHLVANLPVVALPSVSANDVLEASPSSRKYHIMSAVVTANLTHDIFGGVITQDTVLEDHHILPKAVCDKLGVPKADRDSIANRIMVTKNTNSQIIKDQLPAHYYAFAQQTCGEEEAARLFGCSLITPEFMDESTRYTSDVKFRELLRTRAGCIAGRLNSYFNIRALTAPTTDSNVSSEEEELAELTD